MRDFSPEDVEGFRLKNIPIRRTGSRKIACIVGPGVPKIILDILKIHTRENEIDR